MTWIIFLQQHKLLLFELKEIFTAICNIESLKQKWASISISVLFCIHAHYSPHIPVMSIVDILFILIYVLPFQSQIC